MYKELIEGHLPNNEFIRPQPPAAPEQIEKAEVELGCAFPGELRELLSEVNGDRYLCFSCREIVETNKSVREALAGCYDGLEKLLFVAQNGCGDYYGYEIRDGGCVSGRIVLWTHETNKTRTAAKSLAEMITRYYADEI